MTPEEFIKSEDLPWSPKKWDEGDYGAFRNKYVALFIKGHIKGEDILDDKTIEHAMNIAKKYDLTIFEIKKIVKIYKGITYKRVKIAFEPTQNGANWY